MKRLLRDVGVSVGGPEPHDPQILDARFYQRLLRDGTLGLGESYVDGWWEVEAIDELFRLLLAGGLDRAARRSPSAVTLSLLGRLTNPQRRLRVVRDGRKHYDRGLDLFRAMLDRRMTYTCGYWRHARTLDEAQEAKLDLVCRKLELKEGKTLLDIGCGWGSLVSYAAERYGVVATGVTVSPEQAEVARETCRHLPVEIRVQDYRLVEGRYDAVVSVGMFEQVGPKNHRTYMQVVDRCLAPSGISLLHTITGTSETVDPWLYRYIFPGGNAPALEQITRAAEGLFVVDDMHNFGPDYDRTLMAWHQRFEEAWPGLRARYDERFRRLWRYYLLQCAGAFRARTVHLLQIILSRRGRGRPEGADIR